MKAAHEAEHESMAQLTEELVLLVMVLKMVSCLTVEEVVLLLETNSYVTQQLQLHSLAVVEEVQRELKVLTSREALGLLELPVMDELGMIYLAEVELDLAPKTMQQTAPCSPTAVVEEVSWKLAEQNLALQGPLPG